MTSTKISEKKYTFNQPLKENEVYCPRCMIIHEAELRFDTYGKRRERKTCSACRELLINEERERILSSFDKGIPIKLIREAKEKPCIKKDLLQTEKSLFLYGAVGVGKTILAIQIARSILEIKLTNEKANYNNRHDLFNYSMPYFIQTLNFIIKLQCSFKQDDVNVEELLQEVSEKHILIMDDFGSEKMTDFVRQSLLYVINHRVNNELQTIITSNLSLQEIDDNLGSRIGSRIAGMCEVIELKGKDRRLAQ